MRHLRLVLILSAIWAQEESRTRTTTPTPPRPQTRAIPTTPTPKAPQEVVVMETISGRITTKTGEGVPNLQIAILDKNTGNVLGQTLTDKEGNYALVIPASAQKVIVRMSKDGKSFVEKEYTLEELTGAASDIVF
ncbi:MAG: carboxypeptidase-like regulatory domain-containing protein [Bacteroidia bacterium]|nr:carboxypeptidase-like regulatory domain-containing protein [Bacteroidia bacterium]MCX7651831.1 carboxypeptidase-like regulatory domain-containing protein [Bacteroidia bacterium]MDW8416019.1 carboxypeptidase-like regulatory domain-containing protein [Bacteroidia bacterium]